MGSPALATPSSAQSSGSGRLLVCLCQRPLRPALLEPARAAPASLELADGLARIGAERPAAVGDDLGIGGKLVHAALELVDRDRAGAGDVAGLELIGRA